MPIQTTFNVYWKPMSHVISLLAPAIGETLVLQLSSELLYVGSSLKCGNL